MTEHQHTVELEVTGEQIPLLKSLLNQIELTPSIGRIRIEVESNNPFLKDQHEATESGTSTEDGTTTEGPESTETSPSGPSQGERHTTDQLLSADGGASATAAPSEGNLDGPTNEPPVTNRPENTGQAARDYLESDLIDRVAEGETVGPDEFRDIISSPLNPDTNKWYVCGLLHQVQGGLTLGQITSMLDDTDWEVSYKSVSATLSKATSHGWVYRDEKEGSKNLYQLTQLGRDYMNAKTAQTPGYAMKEATEIVRGDDE
ncbi:RodZ family helix-turn-helix domain-containing protein [Salinigranum halophilum]|uniref:hypothetical protein n=1 Tax=Salinigranum halophilum TaxID=2565931 RepID=UPI00115F5325|nr:hypothetical protein [Salinigranum halophilum]